ncbi:MAG: saccharopine dehydrogenase family protein [Calditrichia bacterium]
MKVAVLGGGRVGSAMALDLAGEQDLQITVADRDPNIGQKFSNVENIRFIKEDLSNPATVKRVAEDHDWVINAVPGFMGYRTLKSIIEAGRSVVDIAFFPENPLELDELARKKGVTAIVDCGVAPGMSNLLSAYAARQLEKAESVLIYVGGLPVVREWPYEYRAVFSPLDVIEEYTRPARYVENGVLVTRPALSDPELLFFPQIGTLEAFNTDGLRTLADTLRIPNMKEKTLRYPGHIEKMAVLRETGFFDEKPVEINGVAVRPIDMTAKLLFPKWEMRPEDEDFTVMKIMVEGQKDGKARRIVYDLLDRFDRETRTTSMARTTGYTATVVLRMLMAGKFKDHGVFPPELLADREDCVQYILEGLARRNIHYRKTEEEIV